MPADPSNANSFLFNTDYPSDSLVFLTSGSQVVPNNTSDFVPGINIPHGLPFTPLPIIVWSNTPDFAIANTSFDLAMVSTIFTTAAGQEYRVIADATNINIIRYNKSGSAQTLYYRVFCFPPSTVSDSPGISILPTSFSEPNFILNTDFNYLKLFAKGRFTSAGTFNHNLGYMPRVLVWVDTSPISFAQVVVGSPGTDGINIDETGLTWTGSGGYGAVEYRIYMEN